ncbi:MAG TPA: haloacid dehalogenase type II [Acidimicrobiales bacterium]|nr:haloacid dehalogenase type II [Acidimicrobiales bacterium]
MSAAPPEALLFDVFGTVVDWRGSITAALARYVDGPAPAGGWGSLADRWRREGYLAPIAAMASGSEPRRPIGEVLRAHLVRLLDECRLQVGDDALDDLVAAWDHLAPWPDALDGLARLRRVAVLGTISNGSFGGLVRMARFAGLPWDCVISAELFASYKPDPAVYLGAAALLGLPPGQVALVAAHPNDLAAARACGLRTAFVSRPLEWGPGGPAERDADADWVADDFGRLADLLGA